VAPLALSLWAGRLADRHGLHRPMAVAVVMALVGAGVMVLSQHLAALALGSLLTGGALSVGAVAIQRRAGALAEDPRQLKRVFAWVSLGPALSNAVSPVVAGLLIDHVGFRAAFAWGLVMPLLAWWLARRVPRERAPASGTWAGSGSMRPRSAWTLLRLPALRRLLVVNVVLAACWDAHMFAVPVIGHGRGLSASEIGLVLGAFAVAASVVRLAISAFGERVHERSALRAAMALATVVLLAYAWLPGSAGMLAGSAALGLALGSVQPMVLALLYQVTPPDRHGEALGVRMLATNAATAAMPSGFGLLAGATAAAAPMWLMAGLLVLACRSLAHLPANPDDMTRR
jgi:MFS family permease